MKLCPTCGNGIAGNARSCPHCGKRFTRPFVMILAVIFGLVIVSAIIGSMFEKPAKPLTPAELAKKKKEDAAIQRAVLGTRALKQAMRNPDSFVLSQALIMPDGAACLDYRGQNGFGGMTPGSAVVTPKGLLTTKDSAWNKYCANKTGEDETVGIKLLAR